MITIECLVCEESIKTADVAKAVAFDREHRESCPPSDNPIPPGTSDGAS